MIKIKHVDNENKEQFVFQSEEPVTLEFIQSKTGQIIVYAYKGTEVEPDADPVAMYNSDAEPKFWIKE